MISRSTINDIVESFIQNSDYYIVNISVSTNNEIKVAIDSFNGVSLDYCISLTKEIESKIDRDIEDYELEVSSAGLTEPFKVTKQYEKNLNNEVEIVTNKGEKLVGLLKSFTTQEVEIEIEKKVKLEGAKRKTLIKEDIIIPFDSIKTTKLIIKIK